MPASASPAVIVASATPMLPGTGTTLDSRAEPAVTATTVPNGREGWMARTMHAMATAVMRRGTRLLPMSTSTRPGLAPTTRNADQVLRATTTTRRRTGRRATASTQHPTTRPMSSPTVRARPSVSIEKDPVPAPRNTASPTTTTFTRAPAPLSSALAVTATLGPSPNRRSRAVLRATRPAVAEIASPTYLTAYWRWTSGSRGRRDVTADMVDAESASAVSCATTRPTTIQAHDASAQESSTVSQSSWTSMVIRAYAATTRK